MTNNISDEDLQNMNEDMERFLMRLSLQKGQAFYLDRRGFDYIQYLLQPELLPSLAISLTSYLREEQRIISYISEVVRQTDGTIDITVIANNLTLKKTLTTEFGVL